MSLYSHGNCHSSLRFCHSGILFQLLQFFFCKSCIICPDIRQILRPDIVLKMLFKSAPLSRNTRIQKTSEEHHEKDSGKLHFIFSDISQHLSNKYHHSTSSTLHGSSQHSMLFISPLLICITLSAALAIFAL